MRVTVLLIVMLFAYISPAAAYEVIFHQGFEGEQFPPEGWLGIYVMQSDKGYGSNYSAMIYFNHDRGYCWSRLKSPEIYLEGGELYTFRYYSKYLSFGSCIDSYAKVIFDTEDAYTFYNFMGDEDWTEIGLNLNAPTGASKAYLDYYISYWSDELSDNTYWWIDEVSVVKTATAVAPASLGRVKAAYR